ncbi:MAG: RHS repeat-associated core domain-containing protein [Bacteroides acidifaciens]
MWVLAFRKRLLTEYTKGGETTTFTYDKAGNLTADNRARYTYDLFNRTEKVETFDGHIQVNHYDAEGLRSGIEKDGRLVQFIFRGQEVVTELENDKGMIRYIRGYDLIASDADCARMYYHYASDELGSITYVVAGEDILNRYEYDAWGNLTLCEETVENRFKFNGQQHDPISQQYYLRARYYNPVIGRFTQEDTYRGDGLNLYVYCRNNPVYYADPSGHYRNCVKEAYDRIRQENPGMSAQDAYNLALKETGKDRIPNDTAQNTEQNRPHGPEAAGADYSHGQSSDSIPYSAGDATFMDANDLFAKYISHRKDVDANGYFDVIAHGTSEGIEITHNGQHIMVDHKTAARLIQNMEGYNGQAIRLLSCNTGSSDNGFAQNLANRLNVDVSAPTNYLWAEPNGNYYVAGMNNRRQPDMNDVGTFKVFTPGGNQ